MLLWTFHSTHEAMAAEKAMSAKGVCFNVIPTPRAITRSCGLSLWIKESWTPEELLDIIIENQLPIKGLFQGEGNSFCCLFLSEE